MAIINRKLVSKFYKIKKVTLSQLLEMHSLFVRYYNNADLETFIKDMEKKAGVFVLEDSETKNIVGFSTWDELSITVAGKSSIGIFSGDTVVDKKYWGNKTLQKAFVKRLFKLKLKRPDRNIYWLLISKGYKTYLLLANNFPKHYPNYKRESKRLESVVDQYCNELYPSAYRDDDRLLDFGQEYQSLKGGVAEITDEMKKENPKIKHFEDLNPSWRQGTELPCVGEVTINMIWRFTKKNLDVFKSLKHTSSLGGSR